VLGDDVPGDRQPDPGPLPGGLGRDKRLEQFVPDPGCYTGAVVAHPHFDRIAEIARRHLYRRVDTISGGAVLGESASTQVGISP
jgi:hypothetical protein